MWLPGSRRAPACRHIIQVEMSDAWETFELVLELIALIFGIASWAYVLRAEPRTDREEAMRYNLLLVLGIGISCLLFVIVLNFINTRFFRATRLVVDTCMCAPVAASVRMCQVHVCVRAFAFRSACALIHVQARQVLALLSDGVGSAMAWEEQSPLRRPGRAMVSSKRFLSEVSVVTENSATNTAQQYVVTLPHVFAMDARQILQQWKQIADNMSTQLNLAADRPEPSVAAHADTRNINIMMPSWARQPVADVAVPPPGAEIREEVPEGDPALPPLRNSHLQAAQSPTDPHAQRNGGVAQRRREQPQVQGYVPPE